MPSLFLFVWQKKKGSRLAALLSGCGDYAAGRMRLWPTMIMLGSLTVALLAS